MIRFDSVRFDFTDFLPFAGPVEQDLVDRIFVDQIKELEVAEDIMTAPVQTCGPTETLEEVSK